MKRFKAILIVLALVAVGAGLAAGAKTASVLLQEGLYAEQVDGDLDAAIKMFEQVINDSTAQRSQVAQAMYQQGMCYMKKQDEGKAQQIFSRLISEYSDQTKIVSKVKPLLDELGNADPAALMPPDTLLYLEMGSPGQQIETLLNILKGTPFENPLAAIGGNAHNGGAPGNVVAGFLNPSMMAEFKKIRGIGIGVTGIAQNEPPLIIVLFPGKSDALRGLIMAGLVMLGKPVDAVEGMQCVAFPQGGGAAYDDNVVIAASPKAYSAGQLQWCVKQYKGLAHEPTLASNNKSFAKISRKSRQENALTIWANVDEVYTGLTKIFPDGQIPPAVLMADSMGDIKNIDDLIASFSVQEDGIALEANLGFKDGHNSLVYNMFRTPKLNKEAFKAVPADAIALLSVGLGGADSAQAQMLREKIRSGMGLDVGGDLFANIEQITLFALPVDGASNEAVPGAPPIVSSLGLSLTSPNPQQTRQILTGLLTASNLTMPQSTADPAAADAGRYQIELVTGQTLHCYTSQATKSMILALSPNIIEASAAGAGKSVVTSGALRDAVNRLSPSTNKLVLVNVGGAMRAAEASGALGIKDSEGKIHELVSQLAANFDKTTIQVCTKEETSSLNLRAEITDLPPVQNVIGPAKQLSDAISAVKAKASAEREKAQIPALIMKTGQAPVIDGKADEIWSDARQNRIENTIYSPASGGADLTAYYRAMWDENNLYVLVNVMDDVLKNDSDEFWLDDGVEVFIDADNSRSGGYDSDDYQYFFEWAQANPRMGETQHSRTDGVQFAVGRADGGYRVEIKFPWSTLGTKPSAGTKIGLDVHVNDDDDGGDRDTKVTWRSREDNTWQNPRLFGTGELTGLVGWWKLDEREGRSAADSSGNGHNATVQGNPDWQPSGGKFGGAIALGGDGDFLDVADESAFDCTAEVTIAAWIKTNRFDRPWQAIITKGDDAYRIQRNNEANTLEFACTGLRIPGGNDYGSLFGSKQIGLNEWHHIAGVYDGKKMYIYVDGSPDVSQDASGAINTNDMLVQIGANTSMQDRFWNGLIDEVRIYDYALSEEEVVSLYRKNQ